MARIIGKVLTATKLYFDTAYNSPTSLSSSIVSDAVYGAGWDGVTTIAPSKNAVYDKIQTLGGGISLADVYPIGSIYTEITGVNPATTFGFGTWSAFGAGKVLIGLDSGDTDFDTAEETGGTKTKAISAHAGTAVADHDSHKHTFTTGITVDNHADHTHTVAFDGSEWSAYTKNLLFAADVKTGRSPTNATPKATSGASSTLTHTVNQDIDVNTSNELVTSAHNVTQPNAHSDLNVVQPYVVVYFWKRTA